MEFKFQWNSILATSKVFSMSIDSILSFLHYLLQVLIFNGNQIDFEHQRVNNKKNGDCELRSVDLMRGLLSGLVSKLIYLKRMTGSNQMHFGFSGIKGNVEFTN